MSRGGTPAYGGFSLRPQVARASKIAGRQFSAAARQKPTGLNVCRNGCADVHRGGPYWLPPRRAPFGRKENPPQAGVPPDSASPRSLVTVCEEARAPDGVPRGRTPEPCDLPHTPGQMPRWLLNGNGAAGRDGGGVDCSLRERAWRAASERRPARSSSWWFLSDERVSTHSVAR